MGTMRKCIDEPQRNASNRTSGIGHRGGRTLRFETLEQRQLLAGWMQDPLAVQDGSQSTDADEAVFQADPAEVEIVQVSAAAASFGSGISQASVMGTHMTDAEFFGTLDLGLPGLEAVRAAVAQQDWPSARAAFGEYFKARALPQWFVMQTEPPDAPEKRPDTTVADRLLAHQWQFQSAWFDLGPDIDWSSNQMSEGESATGSWNASLNRHFHLVDLAEAYVATGEEKYAAEVVAQMLDWIEDCPLLQDSSGNSPYHYAWQTLNTACRAGDSWPNALFRILPSEALNADGLVTILKSLVEHARHLDAWPTGANWLSLESWGLVVIGTLLPESEEAAQWRQHAIARLYDQIQNEVYPDGLEYELALGYSNIVLTSYANVLKLLTLNNRTQELPQGYLAQLERMYEYQAYVMMPNWRVPGLNDSADKWPYSLLRDAYAYFPDRELFEWGASRGQEGQEPEITSVAFPYSGQYVMRSGWDTDACYMLFDAGPFGAAHQHEDKLHVIAYAYGQPLLLDTGLYKYDASSWRKYVTSTRGHNTILVDGQEQNRRDAPETWTLPVPFQPLDNTWVTDDAFDFVVGQYDSGFGADGTTQVTHTRAIVFVKSEYWVIVDTLEPQDTAEHIYESLFHLNAEQAQVDPATKSVTTLNADSANLQLWPVDSTGLSVQVIQGQEDPVQGWADFPWRPVPTAAYQLRGRGTQHLITVLYASPPGQGSPLVSVEALPVLAGGRQSDDAVACEIRFSDGRVDRIMVAEAGGILRSYGDVQTSAMLQGTRIEQGLNATFQYSDLAGPQDPEIQVLSAVTDVADGAGSIAFGSTTAGNPIVKTFTVKNLGTGDLTLTTPIFVPAGFAVTSSFGSTTLAHNASTTFTVQLDATAGNTYSGRLSFGNDDSDENPFDFTISGTVTAPEIQVLSAMTNIADGTGSVAFGSTITGKPVAKTFTVKNLGTGDLTLATPILVPAGFSVTSGFGSTILAPNGSTTFTVQLDATAGNTYSGRLSFGNDDSDENPFDFTISGTVTAPEIQVLSGAINIADGADSVDYGGTTVGRSVTKTFTVKNLGTGNLVLATPITVPAGFTVTSSFRRTTLAPNASTTFSVRLNATAAGVYGGKLSLANNDGDENPFDFTISGTATAAAPEIQVLNGTADIVDGTALADFGSTTPGRAVSKTFTVKNLGTGNLTLTAPITVPAGFKVTSSFRRTTLAPNASTTFTVRLNATTAGIYGGKLSFTTNDGDESPFDFTISGTVAAGGSQVQVFSATADISAASPPSSESASSLSVTANGRPATPPEVLPVLHRPFHRVGWSRFATPPYETPHRRNP